MNKVQEKNFKIIVAIKNNSDFSFSEKIECVITLDKQEQIIVYPFSQAIFFNTDQLERSTSFQMQFRTQKEQIHFASLPILIPSNIDEKDEIEIVKQFQFGLPTSNHNLKGSYYIIILNKQVFMDKNSGKQSSSSIQNIQKDQAEKRKVDDNKELSRNKSSSLHSSQSNQLQSLHNSDSKQRGEKSPSNKRYLQSLKNKASSSLSKPNLVQGNSNNNNNSSSSSNGIEPGTISQQYNSYNTSSQKKNSSQSAINSTPSKASSVAQSYLVQNSHLPQRSSSNSRQNLTSSSSGQKQLQAGNQSEITKTISSSFEPAGQTRQSAQTIATDDRKIYRDNSQRINEQDEEQSNTSKSEQQEYKEVGKQNSQQRNDAKMEKYEKMLKYSPAKNLSPFRSINSKKENEDKVYSYGNISPLGNRLNEQTKQQQDQIGNSNNNQSAQKNTVLSSNNKLTTPTPERQVVDNLNNIGSDFKSIKNSEQKPPQYEYNRGYSDQRANSFQASEYLNNHFEGSDTKNNNYLAQTTDVHVSRYPATSDFNPQNTKSKEGYTQSPLELPDSPLKKRLQSTSPLRTSSYQKDTISPVRKLSMDTMKRSNLNNTSPLSKSGYLSPAGNGLNFLMNLDGSKRESKHEIENLRTVIYSLDGKLKNVQQTEQMNTFLTEELKRSEESRKELQLVLQRQVEIEVESRTDVERRLHELSRDKQDMHHIILAKNDEIDMLVTKLDQMALNFRALDKDYHELKVNHLSFDELKHQNNMYRDDLSALMTRLRSSTHDFDGRFDTLYKNINILEEEKAMLSHQKTDMYQQLSTLQVENQNLHEQNLQKQYEIESLLRKLSLQTAYEDGLRINNSQIEALNIQLKEEQRQKIDARNTIENLHRQIMDLKFEREESLARNKQDIDLLKRTLDKSQQTIIDQSEALTEMSKVTFLNKQENNQNEVKRQVIKDLEDQINSESKRCQRLLVELNETKKRSYEQCELLSTQNGEITQLKQNIRELTNIIDEGDEYAQSLKQIIFDLREQHSDYIPIKGDPIDSCLANYLNNYNGDKRKARTLFIREGSGVYQFGSKKLYVKIEQDKVLIRTGGGFIGLEEFLDIYTPSELEKYERKDPLKVYQQNYTVNKKLSQSKCVNEIKEMTTVPLQNTSLGPSFSKIK